MAAPAARRGRRRGRRRCCGPTAMAPMAGCGCCGRSRQRRRRRGRRRGAGRHGPRRRRRRRRLAAVHPAVATGRPESHHLSLRGAAEAAAAATVAPRPPPLPGDVVTRPQVRHLADTAGANASPNGGAVSTNSHRHAHAAGRARCGARRLRAVGAARRAVAAAVVAKAPPGCRVNRGVGDRGSSRYARHAGRSGRRASGSRRESQQYQRADAVHDFSCPHHSHRAHRRGWKKGTMRGKDGEELRASSANPALTSLPAAAAFPPAYPGDAGEYGRVMMR